MGVGGQGHTPAALPPGKTQYPSYRRLGGPQGWSEQGQKTSPPPGFDPWTVKPVASRYTNYAISAHENIVLVPLCPQQTPHNCCGKQTFTHLLLLSHT